VSRDEDAVASVDELLSGHLQVVPGALETPKVVSDRRSAVRRVLLDGVHDEVRGEVGHCILAAPTEHLVLPSAAHDLHVLLRHLPPSICRRRKGGNPSPRQRCRTRIHARTSNGTRITTMMTTGHMGASLLDARGGGV
jgi:hypothetical protein